MSKFRSCFFLALFLCVGGAVAEAAQAKRQGAATGGSSGETSGKGQASGDLSALEAKAQEAEKNNKWDEAAGFYNQASVAARISGQYQKAISYANKALEISDKAGRPGFQARAILNLSFAYRQVGQQAKVRDLLQKGIEIVKQIPSGPQKTSLESQIYRELGLDFLRTRETKKAIDYISYSLQVQLTHPMDPILPYLLDL